MKLPLTGQAVEPHASEYMIQLITANGYELQIEGQLRIESDAPDLAWIQGGNHNAAQVEALLVGTVRSANVDNDAVLRVTLDSGVSITVPADQDFEAWTLVGPGGYRVVSEPGGELAVWDAE